MPIIFGQSSNQCMSPCVRDKLGIRNAVLEWVVSEQLHYTFIHKFNHKFSKLASCENYEILEKEIKLQVKEKQRLLL
jgi:hypothetical protein